jgi:hypothetical protein
MPVARNSRRSTSCHAGAKETTQVTALLHRSINNPRRSLVPTRDLRAIQPCRLERHEPVTWWFVRVADAVGADQNGSMRNPLVMLVTCILVLACATVGPTTAADWPQRIALAIPAEDGAVRFASPGNWLPDTAVYSWMDTPNSHAGVFVLAAHATEFMQWNDDHYLIIWRLPYSRLTNCRVESFGRDRRLVISSSDYRTQSFQLTGPAAQLVDQGKTAEAFRTLKSLVPPQ